jgi:hypothetical protein
MATLRLVCPFCVAETRLQLQAPTGWRTPKVNDVLGHDGIFASWGQVAEKQKQGVLDSYFLLFFALAHCPECNEYSVVKGVVLGNQDSFAGGIKGDDFSKKVTVLRHSPQPIVAFPKEAPEEVVGVIRELEEDYARGRNPGRILAGCRSVLDVCLKLLDGGQAGSRGQRIAALATQGRLTADIAEWAKRLWVDGHDGVHELNAAGHPLSEHLKFLRIFVEVAFVIPERIRSGQI